MMNKKRGFTMAEALSVVILLGVIATITIPTTINRMTANQNRAKIKKALATYDSAVRLMISENRITSVERLNNLMSENNCSRVYNYFKAVEQDGCIFKTTDGIWWDVGSADNGASMAKALIATDRNLLDIDEASKENLNSKNAFYLITDFDERKVPHIADMAFVNQKGLRTQIMNTSKLYAYIDNKKIYNYYNFCLEGNLKACVLKNSDGSINFYNNDGKISAVRRGCDTNGINCKENNLVAHSNCNYNDFNKPSCTQWGGSCPIQDDTCSGYVSQLYMYSGIDSVELSQDKKNKLLNAVPTEGATFIAMGSSYKECELGATTVDGCNTEGRVTYFAKYSHPQGGTIEVYWPTQSAKDEKMGDVIDRMKTFGMTYWKSNPVAGGGSIACTYSGCTDISFSSCTKPPTNSECY